MTDNGSGQWQIHVKERGFTASARSTCLLTVYRRAGFLIGTGLAWLALGLALLAQSAAPTTDGINLDRFPEITVSVTCEDLPNLQDAGALQLREDDLRVGPVVSYRQLYRTQTALFLDLGDWTGALQTRDLIREQLDAGLPKAFDRGGTYATDNSLAVFAPGEVPQTLISLIAEADNATEKCTSAPWSCDHVLARNRVIDYRPTVPGPTPLTALLIQVLKTFDSDPQVRKTLVVFSDGVDRISADQLPELDRQADAAGVTIHTIFVQPTQARDEGYLSTLASNHSGQYHALTDADGLQEMWSALPSRHTMCDLTYRTAHSAPGNVEVVLSTAAGSRTTLLEFTGLQVPPPAVTVTVPGPDGLLSVTKPSAEDGDSVPAQTAPVGVAWSFATYPRGVQRIGYTFQNASGQVGSEGTLYPSAGTTIPPAQPGAAVQLTGTLAFSDLLPGVYTVVVTVTDEVGLRGQDDFLLQLATPEVSEPKPPATPVPTASPTPTPDLFGRVRGLFTGLANWWDETVVPRFAWFTAQLAGTSAALESRLPYNWLLVGFVVAMVFLLPIFDQMRRLRISRPEPPVPSSPPYPMSPRAGEASVSFMLYRESADTDPPIPRFIPLDTGVKNFPEILDELVSRPARQENASKWGVANYFCLFRASPTGDYLVEIRRDNSREIRVNSKVMKEYPDEHILQPNEVIEIGPLRFRYLELARTDTAPNRNGRGQGR